jgi:cytochrome c-type biogenesis protein CcmF
MALPQIGSFALLLALGLAAYSFVVGAFALIQGGPGSDHLSETARRAGIAVFGTVLLASVVLVTAAFTDNFSVAYIYHHSNRDLPGPYKFAVLWSGQEGSLLFWSLILASYAFVLRLRYKTDPKLFAYASVVIAAVQVFFLLLLNIAAHPFAILQGQIPPDGSGLNPCSSIRRWYPSPHAVSGYVGFTIPSRLH